MENASKALIIAGSVLITVMIISVAVYIFNQGKQFSDNAATKDSDAVIQSFNAQFSGYETDVNVGTTITDSEVYAVSSLLNTVSDVVTAINLAANINYENNNGYKYYSTTGVEISNAVEIVVDMSGCPNANWPNGLNSTYKYYLLEPNQNVKSGYIYGFSTLGNSRSSRISSFNNTVTSSNVSNKVSCNTLLETLRETKLVSYNNSEYTLYKYYFKGSYEIDETTSKINSVTFTLVTYTDF